MMSTTQTAYKDYTIVLITGSASGLGYATVQAILTSTSEVKYAIIITARSLDKAKAAVESLKEDEKTAHAFERGCEVIPLSLEITDDGNVQALRKEVGEKYGRVDVLINNAGVNLDFSIGPSRSIRQAFIETFETNVVSTHMFTDAFVDLLIKSASPRIVFISSGISSLKDHDDQRIKINAPPPAGWPKPPTMNCTTYRTSKTAMNMMILEWARVLKNDGVKVHVVDPGLLSTDLGGVKVKVRKEMGAAEPIIGGEFVFSVIRGETDKDLGKMVSRSGVVPW